MTGDGRLIDGNVLEVMGEQGGVVMREQAAVECVTICRAGAHVGDSAEQGAGRQAGVTGKVPARLESARSGMGKPLHPALRSKGCGGSWGLSFVLGLLVAHASRGTPGDHALQDRGRKGRRHDESQGRCWMRAAFFRQLQSAHCCVVNPPAPPPRAPGHGGAGLRAGQPHAAAGVQQLGYEAVLGARLQLGWLEGVGVPGAAGVGGAGGEGHMSLHVGEEGGGGRVGGHSPGGVGGAHHRRPGGARGGRRRHAERLLWQRACSGRGVGMGVCGLGWGAGAGSKGDKQAGKGCGGVASSAGAQGRQCCG